MFEGQVRVKYHADTFRSRFVEVETTTFSCKDSGSVTVQWFAPGEEDWDATQQWTIALSKQVEIVMWEKGEDFGAKLIIGSQQTAIAPSDARKNLLKALKKLSIKKYLDKILREANRHAVKGVENEPCHWKNLAWPITNYSIDNLPEGDPNRKHLEACFEAGKAIYSAVANAKRIAKLKGTLLSSHRKHDDPQGSNKAEASTETQTDGHGSQAAGSRNTLGSKGMG